MNRRLANTLASAAFLAFVSVPATISGAQEAQPAERSGQKVSKAVQSSCPVHPEIKARTAGKCPKCRMQERSEKSARDKSKSKVRQQPGTDTNE